MRAVCEDLNMWFVDGLSQDIIDLMEKKRRQDLRTFADNFFVVIEKKYATARHFLPMTFSDFVYEPSSPERKIGTMGKRIVVLTDAHDANTNLGQMINRFKQSFATEIEVINLNDIRIKGGCLGCMRCGYEYKCMQKDGFVEFYNNRVKTADIIVFAGEVRGRYLSSKWKEFYDRAFFWNHTPSLVGKQLGYLISGPISQTPNPIQNLEASSTARQDANHAGFITAECGHSAELDAQLSSFAERLVGYSEKGYVRPQDFLAIEGHKVFRDNIRGRLRMIWQTDHRYYKKHGKYDFPQRDLKLWVFNPVMMSFSRIPKFRNKF